MLKKPLQTSIAVEVDEFEDIEVEDKLHVVISVKDFRAIIQHAGVIGNDISASYSLPARPIQLAYVGDAIACEFLIMTVGERGSTTGQKTKKGRKAVPQGNTPRLEAASRRTSVAPSEAAQPPQPASSMPPPPFTPQLSNNRTSASRLGVFDLRPSQRAPPATHTSESLFVEDDGWEPVREEDEEAEDYGRLEWDHTERVGLTRTTDFDRVRLTEQTSSITFAAQRHESRAPDQDEGMPVIGGPETEDALLSCVEPTQRLSDLRDLAIFPD